MKGIQFIDYDVKEGLYIKDAEDINGVRLCRRMLTVFVGDHCFTTEFPDDNGALQVYEHIVGQCYGSHNPKA